MAELTKAILAQSGSIKALQAKSDAIHAVMEEMKPAVLDLQKWKPEMESSVEGLRSEMGELRTQVGQIARHPALALRSGNLPPILPLPEAKPESWPKRDLVPLGKEGTYSAMGELDSRLIGRRDESNLRGKAIREKFSPIPLAGNGTLSRSDLSTHMVDSGATTYRHSGSYHPHHFPPKLDFPQFDGENPKAWQLKCENYFRICSVQPEFMVNIATMYFVGGALLWLQASKTHIRFDTWKKKF